MPDFAGYPIVLTADHSLMADYRLLFDGMLAASLTSTTPAWLAEPLLLPAAPPRDGRARVAPLGLRRIEAALLAGGFTPDDVAVVPEALLPQAIGPETRIIGIDAGEPAGHGMNSTTMTGIAGGAIFPELLFGRLLKTLAGCMKTAPRARLVLGGPGAWQVAADLDTQHRLGIAHVVTGYAEGNVAPLFRAMLQGAEPPAVFAGAGVTPEAIPAIRGASTMGIVEISRGCGWGCDFCTLGTVPMQHLPEETILADVDTNLRAGNSSIAVLSEDLLRYGATGAAVNPERLLGLLERLRALPGLRLIQVDHVNVGSVARYDDDALRAVRKLLVGETGAVFPWVNLGVETAAGALLRANGGNAKMGSISDDAWGTACAEQVRRLVRAGFLPMVSLMLGLPGETEADVRRTLRWVEELKDERVTIFPVLYAPVDGTPAPGVETLTPHHWRLLRAAYALNFRWIPRMYWDNQAAAGVPLWKRMLLQGMGKGQVVQWHAYFARHARRARS
jgi:radical SAM superfamily enzyme YgiQ (UPF0313 family)